MQIFDAPSREVCTVRRPRTNTPAAALVLMNDVQFLEAARCFAERMLSSQSKPDQQIRAGFQMATSRQPTADELDALLQLYHILVEQYSAEPTAANALLSQGESERNEAFLPAEHAAMMLVANTILNLDEVITRP